jgi:hypothetical protein
MRNEPFLIVKPSLLKISLESYIEATIPLAFKDNLAISTPRPYLTPIIFVPAKA